MPDVFQSVKWCDTLLLHHIQTGIWCGAWWSLSAWVKVIYGSLLCPWLLFVQPSNENITLRIVMYVLYEIIYSLFIVSEFKFGLQRRWRLFSKYILLLLLLLCCAVPVIGLVAVGSAHK
jgi:hypothetical protein